MLAKDKGDNFKGELCPICYNDYKEDDDITLLPCQGEHNYHTRCLQVWIEQTKSQCPSCKAEITE